MPNYIYSILRVFGPKEERQKFIEYASKIVPSMERFAQPLKKDEKIVAMMDKWYEYKTWENDKGTFCAFFTPTNVIDNNDGYELHRQFPELNFIYRSIDEGWPNHCGKWEFGPKDSLSDQDAKDLEIVSWMKMVFPYLSIVSSVNGMTSEEDKIKCFQEEVAKRCENDENRFKKVTSLFYSQTKNLGNEMDDSMSPIYANDPYFKLTEEEMVNAPFIPECTKIWERFKRNSNSDDDFDDY